MRFCLHKRLGLTSSTPTGRGFRLEGFVRFVEQVFTETLYLFFKRLQQFSKAGLRGGCIRVLQLACLG